MSHQISININSKKLLKHIFFIYTYCDFKDLLAWIIPIDLLTYHSVNIISMQQVHIKKKMFFKKSCKMISPLESTKMADAENEEIEEKHLR